MAPITCDVCSEKFSETENIPKMLFCGHTFCHVCINIFINADKTCPTCNTYFGCTEEFPTNLMVLSQSESQDKPAELEVKPACSCSQMESTLVNLENELLKRKGKLVKHIAQKKTLRNLIQDGIARLGQMLEMNAEIRKAKEVEKLIAELEFDLKTTDAVLDFCENPVIKPSYSLDEYLNPSFFLNDLCVRLHKKETIFAYKMMQSQLKYGKIVLLKDRVCIHALTLTEAERPSSLVSFEDLKKCITPENAAKFRTFITIGKERLNFTITDSSFLASRFIKLCSGENGLTFKGATFKLNYHSLTIENYSLNDVETIGWSDYDSSIFFSEKVTKCKEESIVVQMDPCGSCKMLECQGEVPLKNIIAIVNNSYSRTNKTWQTLGNNEMAGIMDCGISLVF